MKFTKFIIPVLLVGILFSCSKEEGLTIEDTNATDTLELLADLSVYEDSSLGMYKGVFTTTDSQNRGTVKIEVINEKTSRASITYLNGEVELFTGIVAEQDELATAREVSLLFNSSASSFIFNVNNDGSNPIVIDASSYSQFSFITVVKENVRGAVVPLTGSYTSEGGPSGTWSIIFNTGNGEGDDTDITSQTIFNGQDFGSTTGIEQSECDTIADVTNCTIEGMYTSLGVDIEWTGTHTYLSLEDCSSAMGTWSTPTATGTFITDTMCRPENDLCMDATIIVCGDTNFTGTTANASQEGDPDIFCTTSTSDAGGVWFIYTGTADGNVITLDTAGSTFDTKLFVYTGTCGELVCFEGDDDDSPDGNRSRVIFVEEEGVEYFINLNGFLASTGNYVLGISCEPPVIIECGSDLIDSGGIDGNYSNNEIIQETITAEPGEVVTLIFSQFNLETGFDFLRIFDGPNESSPEITVTNDGVVALFSGYTGTSLEGESVTSTGNTITVLFTSDSSVTRQGYQAEVSCGPPSRTGSLQQTITKEERNQRPPLSLERQLELKQKALEKSKQ